LKTVRPPTFSGTTLRLAGSLWVKRPVAPPPPKPIISSEATLSVSVALVASIEVFCISTPLLSVCFSGAPSCPDTESMETTREASNGWTTTGLAPSVIARSAS